MSEFTSETAIEISGLTKTYHPDLHALKSINLSIAAGEFFAFLGPNGAGKSTLIGILTGLIYKTAGTVKIFGLDLDQDSLAVRACLGVVPQEFNFNPFEKVYEIVKHQAGYYGLPDALAVKNTEKYLRELDLWDKRNTIARNLSGGMKRRLMIARALVHEPRILILDEPTAGVDIELRRSMWDFLKSINQAGTTIILTTHYLEEAESLCRRLAIINFGEIIADTTVKVILQELKTETLLIDLKSPLFEVPNIAGYHINLMDPKTLEVSYSHHQGLNHFFEALGKHEVTIVSLRNKTNRLEELFLKLVKSN
jgi:ABC-2 type transport system ATP-binding protein